MPKRPTRNPASDDATRRSARRRVRRLALAVAVLAALLWSGRGPLAALPKGLADRAIRDGRPEAALGWLRAAEALKPGDGQTAFLRARAFRKQGRLDDTRAALLSAAERGHPVDSLEREQWLTLAQAGQLREAEAYLPLLLTDPRGDEAEICEAYAIGFIRNHRVEDALRLLESWSADYPEDPRPLLMKGKFLIELHHWAEAEDVLRRVLVLGGAEAEAEYCLGRVLVERNRAGEALAHFERSAEAAADSATADRAAVEQARCLRILGRAEQGRPLLERILRERPGRRDALIELGRVEAESGRFMEAAALLGKADAARHPDVEIRYAYSSALRGSGRVEEARVLSERIARSQAELAKVTNLIERVQTAPGDVEARYELGRIFLEHGQAEKGLVWLQSVLNYAPSHVATCRLLADHYERRAKENPRFAELAREFRGKAGTGAEDAAPRPGASDGT